jgi:hypothetical protein
MTNTIQLSENKLLNLIKESIFEYLNESRQGIQSRKLYDIIKQHGGLSENGKTYASTYDIHNLTDNDIIDVIQEDAYYNIANQYGLKDYYASKGYQFEESDGIIGIGLNDGYVIVAIVRNEHFDTMRTWNKGGWYNTYKKRDDREKSRMNDGSKQYQWSNPEANELGFRNPYYKQWNSDSKADFMNRMRDSYNRRRQ